MKTVFRFLRFYGECCRVLFIEILYATKLKKRPKRIDPLMIMLDHIVNTSTEMINGVRADLTKMGVTDHDGFLTPKYRAIAIKAGIINENGVITAKGREMMGNTHKLIDLFKAEDLN